MSFNVSGISSGLDTAGIIDSLMNIERRTVRRLEATETRANDQVSAWNLISQRLSDAKSAIDKLRTGNGLHPTTAVTSDDGVLRATTSAEATPGSYQFRVTQLAAAQQVASGGFADGTTLTGAGTARITAGFDQRGLTIASDSFAEGNHTIEIVSHAGSQLTARVNGGGAQTVTINPSGRFSLSDGNGGALTIDAPSTGGVVDPIETGTMAMTRITADASTTVADIAAALNTAGSPVRAQIIDTGDGTAASSRLILTASTTGLANAATFSFDGVDVLGTDLSTIREAADAQLTLGSGAGAITINRSTNSINDVIPGVALDLVGTSPDTDISVNVSADIDARVDNVKAFVDGVNAALTQVRAATRYDTENNNGSPLSGNSAARSIADRLTAAMSTVVPDGSLATLRQIGISFGSDGTYGVDETALRSALETDPDGVARLLDGTGESAEVVGGEGIVGAVHAVVEDLTRSDGRIQTAIDSANATIRDVRDNILVQEARLASTEQLFRRQFTAMEMALAQLQSQSSYIANALGA